MNQNPSSFFISNSVHGGGSGISTRRKTWGGAHLWGENEGLVSVKLRRLRDTCRQVNNTSLDQRDIGTTDGHKKVI